jgi:hypothetical protein
MSETRYLELKWSVSRGAGTYGYNIVTLTDSETGKRYRTLGGGYDMTGAVFGEWLQDVYQDRLRAIADKAHGQVQQRLAGANDPDDGPATINDRTRNESGLYGMTAWHSPKMTRVWVTLDGACGLESMRKIAEAIGIESKAVVDRKGNANGYLVTDTRAVSE